MAVTKQGVLDNIDRVCLHFPYCLFSLGADKHTQQCNEVRKVIRQALEDSAKQDRMCDALEAQNGRRKPNP